MEDSIGSKKTSPEYVFLFIVLLFGLLSLFVTYPLANGDEGYHLSRSYTIFSEHHPTSMQTETLRQFESVATAPNRGAQDFDLDSFYRTKLKDVEADSFSFHLQNENNSFLKIGIGHIPAAVGVLIGRYIYPSYGVMLVFSRLTNLVFFAICMFFIIRSSKVGKWSLVMLFSVPFIQKIASPSYDVYSYIAISAFMVNLLHIAKYTSVKDIQKKQMIYTIFTICLILFAKSNYIFALPSILLLPIITNKAIKPYKKQNIKRRVVFWLLLFFISLLLIYFLNRLFDINHFIKLFFHAYLNVETVGRRGRTLFSVVSTILPDVFNIFWVLCAFFVMLTETNYRWTPTFKVGLLCIFLLNWLGIYAGFYLILNRPLHAFDEVSGRYLHPFIICFLPFTQGVSYTYNLLSSEKAVRAIAIISTVFIMTAYLLICYYRGFILHTTPTWINR